MNNSYYPPSTFSFSVAVAASAGVQTDIDAAFQEVSGIELQGGAEEVSESPGKGFVHQLPGMVKHGNLVLKRGFVTRASALAVWAMQAVDSTLGSAIKTETIEVFLLGPDGKALVKWTFLNAWPVKLEVGALDPNDNRVLTQALEICYTTVTRDWAKAMS